MKKFFNLIELTIVIKDNFSVVGFGQNNFGQLGNPQSPQEGNYVPVVINIPKREQNKNPLGFIQEGFYMRTIIQL